MNTNMYSKTCHPFCRRKVALHDKWPLSTGTHPKVMTVLKQNCSVLRLLMTLYCLIFLFILRYFSMDSTYNKFFSWFPRCCIKLCFCGVQCSCTKFLNECMVFGLTLRWSLSGGKLFVHPHCVLKWEVVSELRWSLRQVFLHTIFVWCVHLKCLWE